MSRRSGRGAITTRRAQSDRQTLADGMAVAAVLAKAWDRQEAGITQLAGELRRVEQQRDQLAQELNDIDDRAVALQGTLSDALQLANELLHAFKAGSSITSPAELQARLTALGG